MWRHICFILAVLFSATVAEATERPEGLLWNRSGLAATLPLQIKTDRGADYLLRLRDVGMGRQVMAAYIRGGEFFRLLVPPGRYELMFASGTGWQGEAELFGPETQHFVLDPPLNFEARVSRKEGHLIDLRDLAKVSVRDWAICQRLALDPESLRRTRPPAGTPRAETEAGPRPPARSSILRYDLESRFCD